MFLTDRKNDTRIKKPIMTLTVQKNRWRSKWFLGPDFQKKATKTMIALGLILQRKKDWIGYLQMTRPSVRLLNCLQRWIIGANRYGYWIYKRNNQQVYKIDLHAAFAFGWSLPLVIAGLVTLTQLDLLFGCRSLYIFLVAGRHYDRSKIV